MLIGMAPPKLGVPIQIRIPRDLLEQIDYRCETTGFSRAETIRRMLRWAVRQPVPREDRP
jgi:metal-responsive CopG/Arc/MetJ family transcriptional regulator